jgi:hypothetical protein
MAIKLNQLWRASISLYSHHVSLVQWTTHLFPITRDLGSKPLGGIMWNRDSPVSIVSLHRWPQCDWSFLWPHLGRALARTVTRPSCWQCDNPTCSHTAFLSWFHTCCRSPFWLHNRRSRLVGGSPLSRACNLTSFSPSLTGLVDYPCASRHKGPGFKSPGGTHVNPGFSWLRCLATQYFFRIISLF